jgi:hypothetical protein
MLKFTLLLFLTSCSFFIKRIDTPLVKSPKTPEIESIQNFCSVNQQVHFQLVGTKDNSQSIYLEMIKYVSPIDFLDHFALWSLLQLSVRPDQSSATSRFQILMNHNGRSHYFDFFSEESKDQYPFIFGIEFILKKFGKDKSLESYAQILNHFLRKKLKVGKEFEHFLIDNYKAIKNDSVLSQFYLRGADILKENETSPFLDYLSVIKIYREAQKKQKIFVNNTLSPFVTDKGLKGSCNYDFNLYDNSIFLIDRVIPVANLYGLSTKDSGFLASSSQILQGMESLQGLPLFKGESKVRSTAVCMIENKNKKIWAFSNQSRDPGQHLFHLIKYGLPGTISSSEVDKLIKHSRHLFLSDPVRLVIESKRSSKKQIENLLKLNIPIYNADHLGNIWAYTQLKEGQRFIIDDRNPGAYSCR